MSPILVRPVREQLEHDRVIRLLQTKFRRKFEVGINPGAERNTPAGADVYPDLVFAAAGRGRRVEAVVEVETSESVNHLEALSEWASFARLRAPFHLYVPSGMVEVARRLCTDNNIVANEIWSYHGVGDEVRFTLVHRVKEAAQPLKSRAPQKPAAKKPAAGKPKNNRPKAKPKPKKAARPTKRK